MNTGISEYHNHINRNTTSQSVTEHRIEYNHEFDWSKVLILDEKRSYNKRLISESILIKKQKNGLNLKNDTELLNSLYYDLVVED